MRNWAKSRKNRPGGSMAAGQAKPVLTLIMLYYFPNMAIINKTPALPIRSPPSTIALNQKWSPQPARGVPLSLHPPHTAASRMDFCSAVLLGMHEHNAALRGNFLLSLRQPSRTAAARSPFALLNSQQKQSSSIALTRGAAQACSKDTTDGNILASPHPARGQLDARSTGKALQCCPAPPHPHLSPYLSCTAGFLPISPKPLGCPAQPSLQPLLPEALAQGGLRTTDPSGKPPPPAGNKAMSSHRAAVMQPPPPPRHQRHARAPCSQSPPFYTSRIASHRQIPSTPTSRARGKEPKHFCLHRLGETFRHQITLRSHALT